MKRYYSKRWKSLVMAAFFSAGLLGAPSLTWAADNTPGEGEGVAIGTGSNAVKPNAVAIGKNSKVGEKAPEGVAIGDEATIDPEREIIGGIAIGKKSTVVNSDLDQLNKYKFGMSTEVGGIAIGGNTYAGTGSIDIGNRTYIGPMGGDTVENVSERQSNQINMTTLGTNSFNNGAFASIVGSYSLINSDYTGSGTAGAYQNFGATVMGSLNQNLSKGGAANAGIGNSILGLANKVTNANGAIVYGAGNKITDSLGTFDASVLDNQSDVDALISKIAEESKKEGALGSTMVIGGGNTAEKTKSVQLIGVNNKVTNSERTVVDGYTNTVTGAKDSIVYGSNNTVFTIEKGIVIGNKRKVTGANDSILIGSDDGTREFTAKNAVAVGNKSHVTVDGGVALGDQSLANRASGQTGYAPTGTAGTGAAWVSTAAAVSVGNSELDITRQVTGVAAGSQDTDAVNVAQLKQLRSMMNGTAHVVGGHSSVKLAEDEQNLTLVTGTNANQGNEYTLGLKKDLNVNSVTAGNVKMNHEGVVIQGGPSVTENGIDAGNKKITNVADGVANTDAANYGQLRDLEERTNKAINGYTILNKKIDDVGSQGAALAALHPLDFNKEDKWSYAAGFGHYGSSNSTAIGAFYRPSDKQMISVATTLGQSSSMFNAGIALRFGKEDPYAGYTRQDLVRQVVALKKEAEVREARLLQQERKIQELEAAVGKLMSVRRY